MFAQRPNDVIVSESRAEITNAFMRGIYLWMAVGLAVTAAFAVGAFYLPLLRNIIFSSKYTFYGMLIGEFLLVVVLSSAIHRLSAFAATGLFLLYSALNGMTLSVLFYVFTLPSIFTAFLTTAGMFGAMSLYGLITKRDLTSMGSFMTMGLFGIIIAMVINMFIGSSMLELGISILGVFIFLGLTAYDTQSLRDMGESAPLDDALAIRRGSIIGALKLYLDFINIFIMLLRIFGNRR